MGDMKTGRGLWALLRVAAKEAPGRFVVVFVLLVVSSAVPVATSVASGFLVGAVPGAIERGLDSPEGRSLLARLAVVAGLFLAEQVLGVINNHQGSVFGRLVNGRLQERVMAASLEPAGIGHLEDPDVLDRMALARNVGPGSFTPGGAVVGLVASSRGRLGTLISAGVVATWSPWLAVVLVITSMSALGLALSLFFDMIQVMIGNNADLRRAVWFRDLALTPGAAKEVRVFGLGGWIERRFSGAWLDAMVKVWAERRSGRLKLVSIALVSAAGFGIGLATVVVGATSGDLDLTRFSVMAFAVLGVMNLSISDQDLQVAYGAAAVPALLSLERTASDPRYGVGGDQSVDSPRAAICFEQVRFTYPRAESPVFAGLDLDLKVGQSLAIVGANGAGKTTLVKLLAGLYQPTAGRITIDGTDLTFLDPASWRRHMAVLFQDFVHYDLSVADNIAFGALGPDGERPDDKVLRRAAERAGALDFIEALPQGWDTVLARGVTGGAELSGGQWQRIALARALVAVESGAKVLVLDEPTANLDVRAEAEIYDRFLDLTKGLTTIVISHRFSTVRRATRIVVIDEGRVVEDGCHEDLIELDGIYARMFRAQAARFADSDPVDGDSADDVAPDEVVADA